MPEQDNPNQETSEHKAAAEYSQLESEGIEPSMSAGEYYQSLADSLSDDVESDPTGQLATLQSLVASRGEKAGERIWNGPDEGDVSEASARKELGWVVKLSRDYILNPRADGSSTLYDMLRGTGDAFEQAVETEVMELFGATGRQYGEVEPDKNAPDRYETRTYLTELPGFVLQSWDHSKHEGLRHDGTDMRKFSILRKD